LPEPSEAPELTNERTELAKLIFELAITIELLTDSMVLNQLNAKEIDQKILHLNDALLELEYSLIPEGMHVIGKNVG
jgi:magnesium chelatase subunit H